MSRMEISLNLLGELSSVASLQKPAVLPWYMMLQASCEFQPSLQMEGERACDLAIMSHLFID